MTDELRVERAKKNLNKALDFYEEWRFHLARCIRDDIDHLTKRAKQKIKRYFKKLHDLAYQMELTVDRFDCPFNNEVLKGHQDCWCQCGKCIYNLGCNFNLAIQLMIAQLIRSLAAIRSELAI